MNTRGRARLIRLIILVPLVFFAIVTRFSRVLDLGYFMIDEERDAFLVRRLLVDHRPLLVGGVIPGGISVGPLFFYLSTIPYAISHLNPIGPAYAAEIVGILSVFATFVVGSKLFSLRVGFLAALFGAFSLLNIIYHRPWWPLTTSQVVTLVTYLSLWNLTRSRTPRRWLLLLVSALIVGAQSDPSTLSLIPLSLIWLWWHRREARLPKHAVFQAIGLFLLAHSTWFLFELRHQFQNSRAVLSLMSGSHATAETFTAIIEVGKMTAATVYRLFFLTGPLDVTKQINTCEEFLGARLAGIWWPGALALFIAVFLYTVLSLRFRRTTGQLLSLHFVISFFGITLFTLLFPGYIHEWLWSFMFPTFFLIAADVLVQLSTKLSLEIFLKATVAIWIFSNLYFFSRLTNIAGLGSKLKIARDAAEKVGAAPYELRSEGTCFRYGGWRYVFELFGHPPVQSYMDYVYREWVYPASPTAPTVVIVIMNPTSARPSLEIKEVER